MANILSDGNFKCIFLYENDRFLIQMSLRVVPRCLIDNKPALWAADIEIVKDCLQLKHLYFTQDPTTKDLWDTHNNGEMSQSCDGVVWIWK